MSFGIISISRHAVNKCSWGVQNVKQHLHAHRQARANLVKMIHNVRVIDTDMAETVTIKPTIQVQSILFNNELDALLRSLESLERAIDLAVGEGALSRVWVVYGDCSPQRCLNDRDLDQIQSRFSSTFQFAYRFFDSNLGSARGHNTLATDAEADYLLIQNPDVVASPRLLQNLIAPFSLGKVGMVEAKQLPIEHPKDYNVHNGETGWATTACALIPNDLFKKLGGFDAESFFLYCDDVDFSWLVRESGYKVVFQPSAVVFHDKRLADSGAWLPSSAERYYSAEAACILAYKWSRPDLAEQYLNYFSSHGDEFQRKASSEVRKRLDEGRMPKPHDPNHRIAEFVGYMYTKHRFAL